jgi:hypothetical protein
LQSDDLFRQQFNLLAQSAIIRAAIIIRCMERSRDNRQHPAIDVFHEGAKG